MRPPATPGVDQNLPPDPPAALEDLVQKIKEFDIDAAMAEQENGQPE